MLMKPDMILTAFVRHDGHNGCWPLIDLIEDLQRNQILDEDFPGSCNAGDDDDDVLFKKK